ncbi:MAG TPA: hypothetical protein VIA06_10290 [Candidatus Dormibacteraeota bacterium]|jgi:hypothetical protein|nr:hypothetical protein [Candidatus Dormibacteraeota bacterium]
MTIRFEVDPTPYMGKFTPAEVALAEGIKGTDPLVSPTQPGFMAGPPPVNAPPPIAPLAGGGFKATGTIVFDMSPKRSKIPLIGPLLGSRREILVIPDPDAERVALKEVRGGNTELTTILSGDQINEDLRLARLRELTGLRYESGVEPYEPQVQELLDYNELSLHTQYIENRDGPQTQEDPLGSESLKGPEDIPEP